jgi:hypothetical protein
MRRKKMRNGFLRFKNKVKEFKRQEYVAHKCMWFD